VQTRSRVTIGALLWLLTACTSVGLQPAQSFEQRLAYAYGMHTAVLTATANAVEAGQLDNEDAAAVLRLSDEARAALDASRLAAQAGSMTTAESRLALATSILTELQKYLNERELP